MVNSSIVIIVRPQSGKGCHRLCPRTKSNRRTPIWTHPHHTIAIAPPPARPRACASTKLLRAPEQPQRERGADCTREQRRLLELVRLPECGDLLLGRAAQALDAEVGAAGAAVDDALLDHHAARWDAAEHVREAQPAGERRRQRRRRADRRRVLKLERDAGAREGVARHLEAEPLGAHRLVEVVRDAQQLRRVRRRVCEAVVRVRRRVVRLSARLARLPQRHLDEVVDVRVRVVHRRRDAALLAIAVVGREGRQADWHVLRARRAHHPAHALALGHEHGLPSADLDRRAVRVLDGNLALEHQRVLVERGRLPLLGKARLRDDVRD
mmetsp:Transcript_8352/g.21475  ORF Transcript_8352/g.21475 Transcript_8352/m.21475 type:complete len:325 (-) Transcript_8352:169-1143(-)